VECVFIEIASAGRIVTGHETSFDHRTNCTTRIWQFAPLAVKKAVRQGNLANRAGVHTACNAAPSRFLAHFSRIGGLYTIASGRVFWLCSSPLIKPFIVLLFSVGSKHEHPLTAYLTAMERSLFKIATL
jgi:hypothetical protein